MENFVYFLAKKILSIFGQENFLYFWPRKLCLLILSMTNIDYDPLNAVNSISFESDFLIWIWCLSGEIK